MKLPKLAGPANVRLSARQSDGCSLSGAVESVSVRKHGKAKKSEKNDTVAELATENLYHNWFLY
jgi:hypothetical protein